MEVLQIVERVGAYAGFAAVIGLAVLSALYFSQARDLRRLREWAGRAPDRASRPVAETVRPGAPATSRGGVGAAKGRATVAPPATAAGAGAPAATPAASGTTAGASTPGEAPGTALAEPEEAAEPDAAPAGPATSTPSTTGPGRPGNARPPTSPGVGRPGSARPGGARPGATGPGSAPAVRSRPVAASPAAAPSERRGLAPRYMALVAAGVVVLGGGIAFGVVQYTSTPEAPPPAPAPPGDRPIVPSRVTVSVLNGTTRPGLAAQVGDRVESAGFRLGNVTNAGDQQRAESVVLYAAGGAREARAVGRELDIEQTERAENGERDLAGTARVIIVVGADMVQE